MNSFEIESLKILQSRNRPEATKPGAIRTRFVIEIRTDRECVECANTKSAHKVYSSTYHLPDGSIVDKLKPGDIYFANNHLDSYKCTWENCDGRHLICILPDATLHPWNIDSRASNCALPDEKTHRCWIRHGDPRVPGSIHVDKSGHTCTAGGGSIAIQGWHGFLHHGELHL